MIKVNFICLAWGGNSHKLSVWCGRYQVVDPPRCLPFVAELSAAKLFINIFVIIYSLYALFFCVLGCNFIDSKPIGVGIWVKPSARLNWWLDRVIVMRRVLVYYVNVTPHNSIFSWFYIICGGSRESRKIHSIHLSSLVGVAVEINVEIRLSTLTELVDREVIVHVWLLQVVLS